MGWSAIFFLHVPHCTAQIIDEVSIPISDTIPRIQREMHAVAGKIDHCE